MPNANDQHKCELQGVGLTVSLNITLIITATGLLLVTNSSALIVVITNSWRSLVTGYRDILAVITVV